MIIDCLIQNKSLSIAGKKSFYSHFHIKNDGNGGYDDSKSPIKYKSIQREVERLCKCKIFIKEEDKYRINPKYVVLEHKDEREKWYEFVQALLENEEWDTYLLVTKYMLSKDDSEKYLDESELQTYNRAVKEMKKNLGKNKEVIREINDAIKNDEGIEIEYKRKHHYSIVPICYVISQDGTHSYLYAERKKTLFQPLDLSDIVVKSRYKAEIDKDKYLEKIKRIWDIDIQSPVKIRLLYDKKAAEGDYLDEKDSIEKLLETHFGDPSYSDKEKEIYEGEIYGINDLKVWLRKYSEYCLVLEPETLRDEFIEALQVKKERYEQVKKERDENEKREN